MAEAALINAVPRHWTAAGPLVLALGIVILSAPACASPPPADSPAMAMMRTFAPDVRDMMIPSSDGRQLCCDLSDCRPAQVRGNDESGWQVRIDAATPDGLGWNGGDGQWHDVPPGVVYAPEQRHHLIPIACWIKERSTDNGFLCFDPATDGG